MDLRLYLVSQPIDLVLQLSLSAASLSFAKLELFSLALQAQLVVIQGFFE